MSELNYKIISITDNEDYIIKASEFFHNIWNIDINEYILSMKESLNRKLAFPRWYIALIDDEIIGGVGVIFNDFHKAKDLYPNICALYVKEEYRNKKIATNLINKVCSDLISYKINKVYLITSHTNFYEKLGFKYLKDVHEEDDNLIRMYVKDLVSF